MEERKENEIFFFYFSKYECMPIHAQDFVRTSVYMRMRLLKTYVINISTTNGNININSLD